MDVAPTCGGSGVAEGTDKDKDKDEDEESGAGCIVGQPRGEEKRPKRSRGVGGPARPPTVCTSPSSIVSAPPPPPPPPAQKPSCGRQNCSHHHPRHHRQKCLPSSKDSTSARTEAVHIQEVAGDDCCLHCVLACLFCELLSMCAVLGDCLACGLGGAACCDSALGCCGCVGVAGEAACSEEACQALLDCGLLGECCGTSDCLEICMECCSICFPS